MSGYFGIGIYHTKTESNVGTLWRSAWNFGAAFIFTIGKRYKCQAADTLKTWRSIPLFNYQSFDEFKLALPLESLLVAVEQTETSKDIHNFVHPKRAVYLLGAEDHGLPESILKSCHSTIHLDTPQCINVAVAGSIVLFDRKNKLK